MDYSSAHALAREISASDEYREYARLKELVEESDTSRALLKEYKRLQVMVQMAAMAHTSLPQEDMARFTQMSSLLYAGTDTSAYLMAEMRLQQMMGDIFAILTKASGLNMEIPGMQ